MKDIAVLKLKDSGSQGDSPESEPVSSPPTDLDSPLPESWRSLTEAPRESAIRAFPKTAVREPAPEAAAPAPSEAAGAVAPPTQRSGGRASTIAWLLLLAVIGEAVAIGVLLTRERGAAVPLVAPSRVVTITSSGGGDMISVDGRDVGTTPYQLTVNDAVREIRLRPAAPSIVAETTAAPAAETADSLVPTRPRSGGLRVSSAIEIQVMEGDRVLGSSADGVIVTTAGFHQLDFVNSEFGYRERRAVELRAGQTIALTITPPAGRLNINAQPWALVSIDGKDAGETPLANVSVPVGKHEILFRHPQLGERKETVNVKSGLLTRLSVTITP